MSDRTEMDAPTIDAEQIAQMRATWALLASQSDSARSGFAAAILPALLDALEAQLAASPGPTESDRRDTERLDAARYRFLRERMEIRSEATLLGHFARCVSVQIGRSRIGALRDAYQQCERDDAFDAAIDAAMSSVGSSNATEEPTDE